jgi:hypothetical protein
MNADWVYQVNQAAESRDLKTLALLARESGSKWCHMVLQATRARVAGRGDDAMRATTIADALLAREIIVTLERRVAAVAAA